MKFYHITEEPIKIYGLAVVDKEKRQYYRVTPALMEKMPQYEFLGRRAVGGRVRFMTDSVKICVRMTLAQTKEDINIPLSGSAGADIYVGKGKAARFLGYIAPKEHLMEEITVEKEFVKSGELELITINLPRNDHLLSMEIGIEEDAQMVEAPEYTHTKPVVFYGSSITEGGCASRVGNSYANIVCRWLDSDFYNFGFSGSARGEMEFAEYIGELPEMGIFVYDYDHNAPTAEHLAATHERFFQYVRNAHPQVPVLMLSRPDVDGDEEDSAVRRDIVRQTYENAKKAGDKKVWFLDGFTFFGEEGRSECTVDGTHPNALGFMRMAEKIYPVMKETMEDGNERD